MKNSFCRCWWLVSPRCAAESRVVVVFFDVRAIILLLLLLILLLLVLPVKLNFLLLLPILLRAELLKGKLWLMIGGNGRLPHMFSVLKTLMIIIIGIIMISTYHIHCWYIHTCISFILNHYPYHRPPFRSCSIKDTHMYTFQAMVDEKHPRLWEEQPIDMIIADWRDYGVCEQRLIVCKTLFTK